MKIKQKGSGFTLLEMLLVLVIMSTVFMVLINYSSQKFEQFRRDKAVIQMQQILTAGMTYYINNASSWPLDNTVTPAATCQYVAPPTGTTATALTTANFNMLTRNSTYLPASLSRNPWGNPYQVGCSLAGPGNFFVVGTIVPTRAIADMLAGTLPLGVVDSTSYAPGFFVTAQVGVPGQATSTASTPQFVSVYHNGGCVPQPTCTTGSPAIYTAPAEVSGVNETGSSETSAIESFRTYVLYQGTLAANGTMSQAQPCLSGDPDPNASKCISSVDSGGNPLYFPASEIGKNFWRVCMQVITSSGDVSQTNTGQGVGAAAPGGPWGATASIMAITRCVLPTEAPSSNFSVWTR